MMKAAIFVPYGNFKKEAGLIYVLANYLAKQGAEITQLRCNGCFSTCARDEREGWKRRVTSCIKCTGEQVRLAQWSNLRSTELSTFLHPDDVAQTFRWINSLSAENLLRAEFRGTNVFSLCKQSFASRFGSDVPVVSDPEQDRYARDLCLGAVHACAASDRFVTWYQPELVLLSGGGEYLSSSMLNVLNQAQRDYAIFDFDSAQDSIVIRARGRDGAYMTKLVFESVETLRNDSKSWAPEIIAVVNEILSFLGYGPDRMPKDLASSSVAAG